MTQIINGLILSVDRIQNDKFTYGGKEVKFEQDKNNPSLYIARTQLSKEEKEAGNLETVLTFNVGTAEGTISVATLPPEGKDFENLTDSEKITKLNSISYQFNMPEPTDRGDHLDTVLQNSYTIKHDASKGERSVSGIQSENQAAGSEESNKQAAKQQKPVYSKDEEEDNRQKSNKEQGKK